MIMTFEEFLVLKIWGMLELEFGSDENEENDKLRDDAKAIVASYIAGKVLPDDEMEMLENAEDDYQRYLRFQFRPHTV